MLLYAHITSHSREIMVSETCGSIRTNEPLRPFNAGEMKDSMNPNKENRSPRESWKTRAEDNREKGLGTKRDPRVKFDGKEFMCGKCSKRYKARRGILGHMKTTHGRSDVEYECDVCAMVFGMLEHLEQHFKVSHSGGMKVECEDCGKSVRRGDLKSHKRTHDGLKCSVCGLVLQTKAELRSHSSEHSKDEGYECDTCKECFPSKKLLLLHMVKDHLDATIETKQEEEEPKNRNKRLKKKKVKAEKPFKCDVENCHYATSQVYLLKSHKFKHNPFYKCVTCQEKLPSRQELKTHMATHGERPYKCDQCNKCYKDKHGLGWHKKVQHDPSRLKFTCELCGKTYPFDSLLTQHINLTHATEKQSVCDICGKNVSKTYLPMHRRTHGEKQYTCDVCQKTFLEKAYLKRHRMIHTGEKPYVCNVCGNLFRQHSTLTIHMRTHTGDRPYKCVTCENAYKTHHNLKKHYRRSGHKVI